MTGTLDEAGPDGLLCYRPVFGLRTSHGRRLAGGKLFRSATPQFVGPAEARRFTDEVGLASLLDLRLPHESQNEGSGGFTETDVEIVNVPFAIRKTVSADSAVAPMLGLDPLVGTYLTYLKDETAFPRIIERLLTPGALPVLVHCTAGKDRTGVVIAVLLDALGVLRADIVGDYARKPEDVAAMMGRIRGMKSYGDAVDVYPREAFEATPGTIVRFLAWVDAIYGGSRAYLAGRGVTEAQLAELSDQLLITDNGGTMSQINTSIIVDASPEDAWKVVGDLAGIHTWVPAISASRLDGDIRTAVFADGGEAHEQIVAHSDAERAYSYTYLDGPIPLDEYRSTLTVAPSNSGVGALVSWNATLQAAPAVVESVEALYDASLAALKVLLEGNAASSA